MHVIRWRHDWRTMARHRADPQAPLDIRSLGPLRGTETILTFRDIRGVRTALDRFTLRFTERRVDATVRFFEPDATELIIVGLETDTRLAPLIFWDLFHAAPVGARLTVVEEFDGQRCFDRRYYASSLRPEARWMEEGFVAVVYRKTAPAPIAADAGLDAWTFGIPSGPGDASAINACVGRILELGIPETEIVLCGQVGPNFLYHDRVRIIGQDMPSTPIRIGEKKNRLAAAASHGNLCLLHDRVILPRGFHRAVKAFGDDFPFVTFQSLYFYDRCNLHGQRYADTETLVWRPLGLYEARAAEPVHVQPWIFGEERYHQAYGDATSYTAEDYVIGGLYMTKRALWSLCPQDAGRGWMEWEDIEHGTRASREWGIPGRINPHAFSQSLLARFRTLGCQWQPGDARMHEHPIRPTWPLAWLLLPLSARKPHLRMSEETFRANLARFARLHVAAAHRSEIDEAIRTIRLDFRGRALLMHLILARAEVRRTEAAVEALIRDFFALLVGEGAEPLYYWKAIRDDLLHGTDPERLRRALMRHWVVRGPMRWFPLRRMFAPDFRAILALPHGPLLIAATVLTAAYMKLFRRRAVHFKGGVLDLARAILDCTPTPELTVRHAPGER